MSTAPINKTFNAAADPNLKASITTGRAVESNAQKASAPKLQLNPPAPQKAINTQLALDNAAAKRTQQQTVQQDKAVPSAKQAFAKAKAASQITTTSPAQVQKQAVQQGKAMPSAKEEFAKSKASGKATQDFNLAAERPEKTRPFKMNGWTKFALPALRQLGKNLPHTVGMIRRWKDDVVAQRLRPLIQQIERRSASQNLQRDFKQAAEPKKPTNVAPSLDGAMQKKEFARKRAEDAKEQTISQAQRIGKSRNR